MGFGHLKDSLTDLLRSLLFHYPPQYATAIFSNWGPDIPLQRQSLRIAQRYASNGNLSGYDPVLNYMLQIMLLCYYLLLQISTDAIKSSAFKATCHRVAVVHPMKTSRATGEALLAS